MYDAMEIFALARGPHPRTYYVAQSPPRCGQIRIKLVELPTEAEPPFSARLLRGRWGSALVDIKKIDLFEYILQGDVIEGEVKNGVLRGVVCNKTIVAKVAADIEGPVLAAVPVIRYQKKLPHTVFVFYAYRVPIR